MMTCDHIGFFTNNADKLIEFYTGTLKFTLKQESILASAMTRAIFGIDSDCRFVKLVHNDFMLELFEPLSTKAHEAISTVSRLNHWGYCVENREEFVQNLREKDVPVIEIKKNDRTVYFVTDPDTNLIEIRD
jgi:catechol 2,3-dioxygenase-like lactoylglutathione lyase family enzyme